MEARNRNPTFNRLIFEFPPNKFYVKIIKARDHHFIRHKYPTS